ncbi:MAG: hypothetical protein HQL73_11920 [Magnetococcales bacterium]|nr:hypothetical protein [Magnetococcales bacterium]
MRIQRLRFGLISQRDMPLPPYKGSAFRGVLGHALKRVVCPDGGVPCEECPLAESCLYLVLLETPASGRAHHFGPHRDPHPFILWPPLTRDAVLAFGRCYHQEISLLGASALSVPHIALAVQEMGRMGLGKGRCAVFCFASTIRGACTGRGHSLWMFPNLLPGPLASS